MKLIELPTPLSPMPEFLPSGASAADCIRAALRNHRAWFSETCLAGGGAVLKDNGVVYLTVGEKTERGGVIAFPTLKTATAGETLDRILAYYRSGRPEDGSGGSVAVWATVPTRPRDLGSRLLARGFEWGWQPHWMAVDLHVPVVDFPLSENLRIAVDDEAQWDVADLPYYSPDEVTKLRAIARHRPRRMWHFGAWLNDQLVGHSILFLTTGRYGVAGIYSVGVTPSTRRQGVGRAVTLAACQFARALGANYALLNAATDIYSRIGFVSLGYGQTWWMHDRMFARPAPTPFEVAFVEALGRGDLSALNALPPAALPSDWDAPLLCGHTPIEITVKTRQPRSTRWLERHSATVTLVDAWDLGWKSRVRRTVANQPKSGEEFSIQGVRTPLHEAAGRGDCELLSVLLAGRPNLTLRDRQYNGTPLNWAEIYRHNDAAQLIRDAS